MLKAVAAQRIADGQDELPFGVRPSRSRCRWRSPPSRMGRLLDAIAAVYRQLGLDNACRGDVVFEQLVTARIIEDHKQDAARVLAEAGVRALSYRTVKRRLPRYARPDWRDRLSGACAAAAALGPSALVLYDVTTLWFDRYRGWVPRAGVLQGTPPRPADHRRAAHRRNGDAVDDRCVRRQPSRNEDDDPAGAAVPWPRTGSPR